MQIFFQKRDVFQEAQCNVPKHGINLKMQNSNLHAFTQSCKKG